MLNRLLTSCSLICVFCLLLTACGGGGGGGVTYQPVTNVQLLSILTDGSATEGFTGLASHVDTNVLFAGIPMFPSEVTLDPAVVVLVNLNVNRFLDTTVIPVFDSGTLPYPSGMSVDSALKKITVTVGSITITWTFLPNSVTRTYSSPVKTSTYIYSTVAGQTSVSFDEKVNQSGVVATYKGTATYQMDTTNNGLTKINSAVFDQSRSETNSAGKTITVNGTVTMKPEDVRPGNLSFAGSYSIFLPSYGQISGAVKTDSMTYLRGYNPTDNSYYNSNLTDATAITFTAASNFNSGSTVANPVWLQGIWVGSFTDTNALPGTATLSVTSTSYSWWGNSADKTTFYGTVAKYVSDNQIEFYDFGLLWGTGRKISDTEISGTWSLSGRSGTFTMSRQ